MPLPFTTLLVALSLQLPVEGSPTMYVAPPAYGFEVVTLSDREKKKKKKKARKERKTRRVIDRSRGSRSVRKYRMLNHKLRPIKYRFRKPQASRIRGGRYSRQ